MWLSNQAAVHQAFGRGRKSIGRCTFQMCITDEEIEHCNRKILISTLVQASETAVMRASPELLAFKQMA